MEPIYLDLHIHTSDDPNNLNVNYDLDLLISKVTEVAGGSNFLVSFTDHNVINEKVYLEAQTKIKDNLILGVELHIHTSKSADTDSYHCHIYFNSDDINSTLIKTINEKLNILYPNKSPEKKDKTIPTIEEIINTFDDYDFILLPHGGQNHATFDSAIPEGKEFDGVMQRSIYYNFFDGFTSRSDKGTEKTINYLKRLGVHEFVNLITCSDNYNPSDYPNPKAKDASPFIPTWMFASPTFAGLRLSLTDSSRLEYSTQKPRKWRESIQSINLKNEFVDIDVRLTPGLNVIIGESSSGKTMLVDSLRRKLERISFADSPYIKYGLEHIVVNFPDNVVPHYISQNFIAKVIGNNHVNEIDIIRKIFPSNVEASRAVTKSLEDLDNLLDELFNSVQEIETLENSIRRTRILTQLMILDSTGVNHFSEICNAATSFDGSSYSTSDADHDFSYLTNLDVRLSRSPFVRHNKSLISDLQSEILRHKEHLIIEEKVREVILSYKKEYDNILFSKHGQSAQNKKDFDQLIGYLSKYRFQLNRFKQALNSILEFSINFDSKIKEIKGIKLVIENQFKLDLETLKSDLNSGLLLEKAISDLSDATPEDLYPVNFKKTIKGVPQGSIVTYKAAKDFLYEKCRERNIVNYKIITPDGRDFSTLSPGLKSSLILELILNYEEDLAPLIIDQPEDNLATSYINAGLVESVKQMKRLKQVIFVSHNATIPMSADAQNLILCQNIGGKIVIRSSALEGDIDGKSAVDHVALITDGGKSSVKKRFKKYNLKEFNN